MKVFTLVSAIVGTVAATKRDGYAYMDDWDCTSADCFIPYVKSVVTTGLNNVLLAFAMPVGSTESASWYYDSTGAYYGLTDAQRSDVLSHYAANDARLWMSLGGGTYHAPTYLAQDPATIARITCTTAKNHGYYGVDFDLEEVKTENWGQFLPWAMTASQTCKDIIGHIAHAPQVPYLGSWLNYGYEQLIPYADIFLTQYYNQGRPYNAEVGVWAPNNDWNFESWTDIVHRSAMYQHMVVIGKYIRPQDGGSGIVTASEFDALLKIGEDKYGYNNGYMIWKIPKQNEAADLSMFINTQIPTLAAAGPSGGSVTTKAPTTTTQAPTTTTKAGVPPPVVTDPILTTTTTHATSTTTSPNGGGGNGSNGSDPVLYCQSHLTHPNPDWAQNCKDLCVYYNSPAWCPAFSSGEGLMACVLQFHSASCNKV